jgi:hypothetical protein
MTCNAPHIPVSCPRIGPDLRNRVTDKETASHPRSRAQTADESTEIDTAPKINTENMLLVYVISCLYVLRVQGWWIPSMAYTSSLPTPEFEIITINLHALGTIHRSVKSDCCIHKLSGHITVGCLNN